MNPSKVSKPATKCPHWAPVQPTEREIVRRVRLPGAFTLVLRAPDPALETPVSTLSDIKQEISSPSSETLPDTQDESHGTISPSHCVPVQPTPREIVWRVRRVRLVLRARDPALETPVSTPSYIKQDISSPSSESLQQMDRKRTAEVRAQLHRFAE